MRSFIIVSLAILFICGLRDCDVRAEDGWTFERNQDGIEVYLRYLPGSNYKEFKGVMYVKGARLSSMVAAFDDTPSYPRWMHNCIEAKLLRQYNARERYTYTVTHAPFPATDRDLVVYSLLSQNPKDLTVTIDITGKSDYISPIKNRVRIPRMNAKWTFKPVEPGVIMVVYQTANDPGGWLPIGLINLSMIDLPFYTMLKFKGIVKETKYASARIPVIREPRVF